MQLYFQIKPVYFQCFRYDVYCKRTLHYLSPIMSAGNKIIAPEKRFDDILLDQRNYVCYISENERKIDIFGWTPSSAVTMVVPSRKNQKAWYTPISMICELSTWNHRVEINLQPTSYQRQRQQRWGLFGVIQIRQATQQELWRGIQRRPCGEQQRRHQR